VTECPLQTQQDKEGSEGSRAFSLRTGGLGVLIFIYQFFSLPEQHLHEVKEASYSVVHAQPCKNSLQQDSLIKTSSLGILNSPSKVI
jgi:hypothetical protein